MFYIFTLLLAPFASKLVNYSRHSESLNIRKNSEIDDIFLRRQLIVDFQTYFMTQIINQFWRKMCQKKRKDVDYKLLYKFFQKYFFVHEQSAVENSFSTYVCYDTDGLFWLNL